MVSDDVKDYFLVELGSEVGSNSQTVEYSTENTESERIVADYYLDAGYEVVGLDSPIESGALQNDSSVPEALQEELREHLRDNYSLGPLYSIHPLTAITQDGKPDFFLYQCHSRQEFEYLFVEVKSVNDGLRESQLRWTSTFNTLPYRVVYVVEQPEKV